MTINANARVRYSQPLEAVNFDESLLSLKVIQALTGLGRTTIYSKIKSGELKVERLGTRCNRVRGKEAKRFLSALGQGVSA